MFINIENWHQMEDSHVSLCLFVYVPIVTAMLQSNIPTYLRILREIVAVLCYHVSLMQLMYLIWRCKVQGKQ